METMTSPLPITTERELQHYSGKLRQELHILETAGLEEGDHYTLLRTTLDGLKATLAASGAARRAEQSEAWKQETEREATVEAAKHERLQAKEEATEWLHGRLADGPAPRSDVEEEAHARGFSVVLDQALQTLEVREIAGKYLFGTRSPESSTLFWRIHSPHPGVDRPAKAS